MYKNIIAVLLAVFTFSEAYAQTDLEIGLQYYSDSEYEKALEYLESSRKLYNPQAYEALLNSYLALAQFKDAEDLVDHYLRRSSISPMELMADKIYVAKLAGEGGEVEKAMRDLLERIEKSPSLAYSAGHALQKRGYAAEAMQVYQQAEKYNANLNFDYQKALLYGELGDLQGMYDMYVKMVERNPAMLSNVKTMIAQSVAQSESFEDAAYLKEILVRKIQEGGSQNHNDLLIFVYIQEGNFRGAFTQLKALDKRFGGNRSEIFNLGTIAHNNQEYELAQRIFEFILEAGSANPFYEDAMVKLLLSRQAALLQKNTGTIEEWRALQADYLQTRKKLYGRPQQGILNIDLAHLTAFRLHQLDSAIKILQESINSTYISKEDKALAQLELGDILLYSGEQWEAILYYAKAEKAFEQSPIGQDAKFRRARAAYFVGNFEWSLGIFDALKASTSKLIANDALHYSLLINDNIALDTTMEAMKLYARADLLHYQQQPDSAMIILNQLIRNFPGHSLQDEARFLKATILRNARQFGEAYEELAIITNVHSEDILADDALFQMAELAELHLGRPSEASDLYQRIFVEFPDSFHTAEARKRFRRLRGDELN